MTPLISTGAYSKEGRCTLSACVTSPLASCPCQPSVPQPLASACDCSFSPPRRNFDSEMVRKCAWPSVGAKLPHEPRRAADDAVCRIRQERPASAASGARRLLSLCASHLTWRKRVVVADVVDDKLSAIWASNGTHELVGGDVIRPLQKQVHMFVLLSSRLAVASQQDVRWCRCRRRHCHKPPDKRRWLRQ